MRYNEVRDEWAKLQTINEYITHIGWDEFKSDITQGVFFKEARCFECAVWYESGGITPADDLYNLDDELAKLMDAPSDEDVQKWVMKLIINGKKYANDKGHGVTSPDELAIYLNRENVYFDDDGNVLLVG